MSSEQQQLELLNILNITTNYLPSQVAPENLTGKLQELAKPQRHASGRLEAQKEAIEDGEATAAKNTICSCSHPWKTRKQGNSLKGS